MSSAATGRSGGPLRRLGGRELLLSRDPVRVRVAGVSVLELEVRGDADVLVIDGHGLDGCDRGRLGELGRYDLAPRVDAASAAQRAPEAADSTLGQLAAGGEAPEFRSDREQRLADGFISPVPAGSRHAV